MSAANERAPDGGPDLERLRRFVEALGLGRDEVNGSETGLDGLAGDLRSLGEDEPRRRIEVPLGQEHDRVEDAFERTEAEVRGLGTLAESLLARLQAVGKQLEDDGREFAEARQSERDGLREDRHALDQEGYEPLQGRLEALEGELGVASASLEQIFTELERGLDALGEKIEGEAEDVTGRIEAHLHSVEEAAGRFKGDSDGSAAVWSGELAGALEPACAKEADEVEKRYDDWNLQAQQGADELITAAQSGIARRAEAAQAGAEGIETQGTAAADALQSLADEVAKTEKTALDSEEELSSMNDSLLSDLAKAVEVIVDVAELIAAMG